MRIAYNLLEKRAKWDKIKHISAIASIAALAALPMTDKIKYIPAIPSICMPRIFWQANHFRSV